jgi:hypothetical protein
MLSARSVWLDDDWFDRAFVTSARISDDAARNENVNAQLAVARRQLTIGSWQRRRVR